MSTMLVKNVRKITVLPNQRMHASSKKRMTKLIEEQLGMRARDRGLHWPLGGRGRCGLGCGHAFSRRMLLWAFEPGRLHPPPG